MAGIRCSPAVCVHEPKASLATEPQPEIELADMLRGELDVGLTLGDSARYAQTQARQARRQFLTCRAWLSCCSRPLSSALVAAWDSMRASALSASSPAPATKAHQSFEHPLWFGDQLCPQKNTAGSKTGQGVHLATCLTRFRPCMAWPPHGRRLVMIASSQPVQQEQH